MQTKFTFGELERLFPTEDSCLELLKNYRYPEGITCKKCKEITPHYKLKKRRAYECEFCDNQTYPLAGTIFHGSRTPLKIWFYTIFLIIHTRSGISAKALERYLGVTYKTAWRMFRLLRNLMSEDKGLLSGIVEADETWVGGKSWFRGKDWWSNWQEIPRQPVLGMVERNGRVRTKIIEDTSRYILTKEIKANIAPESRLITDGHQGYWKIHEEGYKHDSVNHTVQFVDKFNKDIHIQTIEGFWGQMKRGITGVYRHISKKYLQSYMDEYAFRYNHRKEGGKMFEILLKKATSL